MDPGGNVVIKANSLSCFWQALEYVQRSKGLERTRELAAYHASQAVLAIEKLPPAESQEAAQCRRALIDLTERVLTRRK